MMLFFQNSYKNQAGQIAGTNENSTLFDIKRGVRQGCVLSPRLFCAVLEMAMGMWRGRVRGLGLDLGDGGPTLLDFVLLMPLVRSQRQNIVAFSQLMRFYHTTLPGDKRISSRR